MFKSTLTFILGLACAGSASVARADGGWVINRFDARLEVSRDGALDVTETIDARFDEPRHGIFREIPVRYDVNGHLYDLRMHLKAVDDGAGASRNRSVTDNGNLIVIKIGDAGRTLLGPQTYVIRYRVARAILWEGDHAILRWNATGNEWRVPIGQSIVTVVLPEPLDDSRVLYDAWTGRYGAKQKDFKKTRVDDRTLRFESAPLAPGEGITVEVAMPESAVLKPSFLSQFAWWLADNFVYALIPLGLVAALAAWNFRGKDIPGLGAIVVNYEPPEGLGPAEVGTLADEQVDLRDVSSVLIDLAVRGFLTIQEVETPAALWGSSTDYAFHKKKQPIGLKPYEEVIYQKVFGAQDQVKLSTLQNKFYDVLPQVRDLLYGSLAANGYFDGKPDGVRTRWLVLGLFLTALSLAAAAGLQYLWIGRLFFPPLIVTGIVLALITFFTSRVMPRRTRQGRIAWEKIRGLEEFISRAEVDDLKDQERKGVFERLLPYAAVFNLTSRWTKAFEGLYQQPPDWYRPAGNLPFTMLYFGNSLDRSLVAMNSTFPTQPRSEGSSSNWSSGSFSGGGSSGGGFGGGGGGSW